MTRLIYKTTGSHLSFGGFFVINQNAIAHPKSLYLQSITYFYAEQKNPQSQGISKSLRLRTM